MRVGSLLAAVTVTGLTVVVTVPLALALLRNGSTLAGVVALLPALLVGVISFSRVVGSDHDEQPPPGSHEAL